MIFLWNPLTTELNISPRPKIDTLVPPITMLLCSFIINSNGTATITNGPGFTSITHGSNGSYIISTTESYDAFYFANFSWSSGSTTNPARWMIDGATSGPNALGATFLISNGTSTQPPTNCRFYLTLIVGQPI